MADEVGAVPKRRRRSKRLALPRYFYLDSNLHKVLRTNRAQDLVWAWHYVEGKQKVYPYSEVRKKHGKAYSIVDVSEMIGRHRVIIENYILDGKIRAPQRIYALGSRKPGAYYFSEKDVYELHDYLLTVHRGRPRKDGMITPSGIPSRAELRAMLVTGHATYIKNEKGEFVQVWKENDW